MGRPSRIAGRLAIDALDQGFALVQEGVADALVTAPVSKESFCLANYGFPGHTEWLASRCGVPEAAMLMVSGPLRAILMTRHVPLSRVSTVLTKRVIQRAAELGYEFVKTCILPHPALRSPLSHRERAPKGRVRLPRLALCGLNPHAGDHGIIGTEERRIFMPALRALKRKTILVAGPLPADSVYPLMARGRFDLALAAYHDQGMIPLKLYAPDRVVNVTLGLPFVRTSPGHGTAYDIAGQGKAHPGAMIEAILLAAQYCR